VKCVRLPYSKVFVNTGDPIEDENLLEFRLLYQGDLPPSGNKGRPKEKHAIRRIFHPQLRRLWGVKPNLQQYLFRWFQQAPAEAQQALNSVREPQDIRDARLRLGIETMGKFYAKAGYQLVPLVVPEFAAQCSIDILVLRPGERIVFDEQGDLDGQVRTIIDALRMPDNPSETDGAQPEEDECPLFCLLQNDKLISEIKVTADELLQLPEQAFNPKEREGAVLRFNQMLYGPSLAPEDRAALELARKTLQRRGEVRPHDAFVVIHVRLNHRDARTFDNYLG
jgi:hypothetical protein